MGDSEIKDKSIVYLFGFSPWQGTQLKNLLNIIENQLETNAEVTLILIHDGVIGTSRKGITPPSLEKLLNLPISVHVMIPDLKARAINPEEVLDRIYKLEYDDLVDILVDAPRIVSWM